MKKDDKKLLETAREILTKYLEAGSHRKTPERYAILEEVYLHKGHFDIESLYILMKEKKYSVSRATLYNTIELLLDCDLVTRHQFGKNTSFFERSYSSKQHDHLVCTKCGKVQEFCDLRLHEIIKSASENNKFKPLAHSLYIYGECSGCKKKQ